MQLPVPPVSVSLESVAIAFCGIVLLWLVRVTIENRDAVRDMRVALFGVNGENGLNGTVKLMKEELDTIKDTVVACQASHGLRGQTHEQH